MLNALVNRSRPLDPSAKVLVLGHGFSGRCFRRLLEALGTQVISTRRQPAPGSPDLPFDSETGHRPDPDALADVTHVLCTIPPTTDGRDPVLTQLGANLRDLQPKWVGYLSTTGVYGDRKGGWVSETDPATPGQERSRRRLACEEAWLNSGLPVQILRLPGIYGPGRSVLESLRSGRSRWISKPDQVFCRIHVEDIAGACLHLIHRAAAGQQPSIINVSDNMPAPSEDLLAFAAELLNCNLPPQESFETAALSMSTMARSFWSENRRVSNQLLCDRLGYTLLHPDYRSGLLDCLNQTDQ